MKVKKKIVFHS